MPDVGLTDGNYEQAIQIARSLAGLAAFKDEEGAKRLLKEIEGMLSGLRRDHARLERRNAEMLEKEIREASGPTRPPTLN